MTEISSLYEDTGNIETLYKFDSITNNFDGNSANILCAVQCTNQCVAHCFKSLQRTSTLIRLGVIKTNDGVSCSDCSQHLHYIPPALQFIVGDFLSIGGGLEMLLTVKFDIQIDAIPMHVKMVLMMMETMRRNSNLFFQN